MVKNELMKKRIEKTLFYFENIYDNKEQYKPEWAFKDAQNKLDEFVSEFKCSKCCSCDANKKIDKKMKRNMLISQIFSRLHLGITITETIISALFVLIISQISHSVDVMIESHMLSFYFLAAFALVKVLLENNIIRPAFVRLSWFLYKYSYDTLCSLMENSITKEESVDVMEPELEMSFG